jgi:hypothetical protein
MVTYLVFVVVAEVVRRAVVSELMSDHLMLRKSRRR